MSEEENEGGMSTIKKTLLGLVTTVVTGAGVYITTHINDLFGVEDEEVKTEEVTPTQSPSNTPIILNIDNSSQNNAGGGTTVIKEKTIVEKPVKEEKSESEDAPW